MDISSLWNEYGLEELNRNLSKLFPDIEWNMKVLFEQIVFLLSYYDQHY